MDKKTGQAWKKAKQQAGQQPRKDAQQPGQDKQRQKIAIIGTGISGLGAASLLHPHHEITVYEREGYIGGHSRTVEVATPDGIIPVDTGFIVFNHRNYPLLTRLFTHLDVPVVKSDV